MEPLGAEDPRHIGPFRLLAVLGSGGMATVYLAEENDRGPRDPALAVVKALKRPLLTDHYVRRLFRLEIESLGDMRANGTLRLLKSDPDGVPPWFATEYVAGMDLRELVCRHGPLGTEAILRLAAEIAPTLLHLEKHNLVHRDLKPSNILILGAADGSLRLIDFGVARRLGRTVTQPVMRVGTDAFMAPEQVYGKAGHPSDMFALGLTLAYAATGAEPERPDLHEAFMTGAPSFPVGTFDGLDSVLRGIVVECTRPAPADRLTARGLLDRLARHGLHPRENQAATWLSDAARTHVLLHEEQAKAFLPGPTARAWVPTTDKPVTRWTHKLGGRACFTSPVDTPNGIAVCSLDGSVRMLSPEDGTVLWRRDMGARVESTPAAGLGMIFVPCSDRTLRAMDSYDGTPRWTYHAGDNCLFAPVVHSDRVLVGARDGAVHCLAALDGSVLWINDRGNGPIFDRPTVTKDRVFVSAWQAGLRALSLDDGSDTGRLPTLRDLVGAPVVHEHTLLVADRTGTMHSVDARTGRHERHAVAGAAPCAGPVLGHGLLYLAATGGTVWAFDARTGVRSWHVPGTGRLRCAPVLSGDTLHVPADGGIVALDPQSGKSLWAHHTGADLHASPLVTRDQICVTTWDCTVMAIKPPGTPLS